MYYQKKFFALALLFSGLFLLGCNKDKKDSVTNLDLDKILKLPYSQLEIEEQKVKLENESLAFLELCNTAKTSPAFEAMQNLNDLLNESTVEFGESTSEKSTISIKSVKAAVEYADYYGIYTWNASKEDWDWEKSDTELKFVFPANKNAQSNNAAFSIKAVSSGIVYLDTYYLPKSVTAILTVDKKEVAKYEFSAEYKDNKPAPVKTEFKFSTGDGYSYWWKIEKGDESQFAMKMSYKNQLMFEALFKTGAKFDQIFDLIGKEDPSDFYNLLDKVNGYVKLMDDLALVYTIDVAKYAPEANKIDADFNALMDALDWNSPDYYSLTGKYKKEESDKYATAYNNFIKVVLVSTKDNYKIADVTAKSEKIGEYEDCWVWNGTGWECSGYAKLYDEYGNVPYLRFGDGTEVAMSAYFSEGFDDLREALDDYIKRL